MRKTRLLLSILGSGILSLGLAYADETSKQARALQPSSDQATSTAERRPDEESLGRSRPGGKPAAAKPRNDPVKAGQRGEKKGNAQIKQVQPMPWHPETKRSGVQASTGTAGNGPISSASSSTPGSVNQGLGTRIMEQPKHQSAPSPMLKPAPKPLLPATPSPSRSPATIGGPALSTVKNSGVLNGSAMKHNP